MQLRDLVVFGASCALAGACGGGSKGGETTTRVEEVPAGPDLDGWYQACGLYTTADMQREIGDKPDDELTEEDYEKLERDPAMQTPGDVDACMRYVRWVMDDRTDVMQIVGATDIAYALCFGEAANGEACYYKALTFMIPGWQGEPDPDSAEMAHGWLETGCEYNYRVACDILESGRDAEGRVWFEAGSPDDGADGYGDGYQ